MDCAKGINFVYSNGGTMRDYWGVGKATQEMVPMIAVPTTAGTGSESQSFALISDAETHVKMACGDKKAACKQIGAHLMAIITQEDSQVAKEIARKCEYTFRRDGNTLNKERMRE